MIVSDPQVQNCDNWRAALVEGNPPVFFSSGPARASNVVFPSSLFRFPNGPSKILQGPSSRERWSVSRTGSLLEFGSEHAPQLIEQSNLSGIDLLSSCVKFEELDTVDLRECDSPS